MYTTRPNLLLGFHGCEKKEQEKMLESQSYFKKSKNSYDWLGHGMYFWENNQARAMNWAKLKAKSGSIKEPAVIGAVIEYLHNFNSKKDLAPYDSVRAAFLEGNQLYPGAGFREKTHVQICVRNPNCIKGFFLPRKMDTEFSPV